MSVRIRFHGITETMENNNDDDNIPGIEDLDPVVAQQIKSAKSAILNQMQHVIRREFGQLVVRLSEGSRMNNRTVATAAAPIHIPIIREKNPVIINNNAQVNGLHRDNLESTQRLLPSTSSTTAVVSTPSGPITVNRTYLPNVIATRTYPNRVIATRSRVKLEPDDAFPINIPRPPVNGYVQQQQHQGQPGPSGLSIGQNININNQQPQNGNDPFDPSNLEGDDDDGEGYFEDDVEDEEEDGEDEEYEYDEGPCVCPDCVANQPPNNGNNEHQQQLQNGNIESGNDDDDEDQPQLLNGGEGGGGEIPVEEPITNGVVDVIDIQNGEPQQVDLTTPPPSPLPLEYSIQNGNSSLEPEEPEVEELDELEEPEVVDLEAEESEVDELEMEEQPEEVEEEEVLATPRPQRKRTATAFFQIPSKKKAPKPEQQNGNASTSSIRPYEGVNNNNQEEELAEPEIRGRRRSTRNNNNTSIERPSTGGVRGGSNRILINLLFKCFIAKCSAKFNSKKDFDIHLKTVHRLDAYPCLFKGCKQSFPKKNQLLAHLGNSHSNIEIWNCTQCAKTFADHKFLHQHIYFFHQPGKYRCGNCDFESDLRGPVYTHFKLHQNFSCAQCGKSFNEKSNLKAHERIHIGVKPFRCTWPECEFASEDQGAVTKHIRSKHFRIPVTLKKQKAKNIHDTRDPRAFMAVVSTGGDNQSRKRSRGSSVKFGIAASGGETAHRNGRDTPTTSGTLSPRKRKR